MENSELTKVILDVNGFPVPQYYSEENELYAVETTDGSLVLSTDVNFALIPMLLDYNGFPIPQLWDPDLQAFVPRTTQSGGGSGGGGDYTLPTATTTRLGGVKPDGVTVETDANGVLSIKDGAVAPIQSLVRSVNFFLPDPDTGDVALPPIPPPEYRYVDVLSPLEPESEYEMGTTAFITYFERATMPEWAAIFDNPNVPDGDMMVVTHKYNNGVMHCIQMVDTFRDGEFKAQFSRQWDYTEDEWTPLNDISYVQSVNGIKPNVSGDITIPEATTTVKGIVQLASGHNASQNPRIPTVQVMNTAINQHANQKATTGVTGHVRVDGTTITVDANGIISATGSGTPIEIVDNLASLATDKALSANQGRELASWIDAVSTLLSRHVQTDMASDEQVGHVKPDGTTITVDANGVISAVGGNGNEWTVGIAEPPEIAPGALYDRYIVSGNGNVWVSDGSQWVNEGWSMKGPKGDQGEQGEAVEWFVQEVQPGDGNGKSGDLWLKSSTGEIYYHNGSTWATTNTIIKGPKGDDGDPLQIVDSFGVYDSDKALSVNMGSELNDFAQNLYSSLIAHMDLKASSTDLGHVKVDGSTISIDANGVISANGASGFKIDNNIIPSQAPSTYSTGVTMSYIPVDHPNNADWLSFYGTYYYNSNSSTFKMNFVVTTVKDSTDKTTQTVRMYGNKPKTNFELTTATRTSNDDADTWMTPLATMPIQRNSGTPTAWKNALAGTLYYDHSGKGWFYKKFDGANDISDLDWAPLVPSVLNVTDAPTPPTGEDFVYSAESVKEMIDIHESKKATLTEYGHVKVDGTTINANDGTISVPTASLTSRGVVQLYNSITSNSTVAATPSAVNSAIIAHAGITASTTVLGHVKVDGTSIVIDANGVISSTPSAIPDATPTVKGITKLYTGVNNATDGAVTPLAVQGAINAHVSQRASTSIWGHVRVDGTSILSDNGTISFNKNNFVIVPYRWEFDVSANATNVPVGTSSLTVAQLYAQANVYDEGVLMSKSAYNFTKTGDLFVLNFTNAVDRARKVFVIINQIQTV